MNVFTTPAAWGLARDSETGRFFPTHSISARPATNRPATILYVDDAGGRRGRGRVAADVDGIGSPLSVKDDAAGDDAAAVTTRLATTRLATTCPAKTRIRTWMTRTRTTRADGADVDGVDTDVGGVGSPRSSYRRERKRANMWLFPSQRARCTIILQPNKHHVRGGGGGFRARTGENNK